MVSYLIINSKEKVAMKKSGPILIIVGVVLLLFLYGVKQYNKMVQLEEGVKTAWAQVENAYQRRSDLIPNLVETVKGYAEHEKSTLEAVIQARANATQTKVDPENLTPEAMQEFMKNQSELSGALNRLLVTVERYPDLKANENFKMLQVQLEGTENRIAVERGRFNETAKIFNQFIRIFPKNIVASITGFKQRPYFEAEAGSNKAPEVKF